MSSVRELPSFKRLPIGTKFLFGQDTFRKETNRGAIRLLPNGTGMTNAIKFFSRSAHVNVIEFPKSA
jgi:hypothetical protein